MLVLIDV